MKIKYALGSLTFHDGHIEDIPTDGVTVIVGPNSAGKSVLLSEIAGQLRGGYSTGGGQWLIGSSRAVESDQELLKEWFLQIARTDPVTKEPVMAADPGIGSMVDPLRLDAFRAQWPNLPDGLHGHLMRHFGAGDRLYLLQGYQKPDLGGIAHHPMQALWQSPETERRYSAIVKRAFGFPVCINRHVSNTSLLVGAPSEDAEPVVWDDALVARYREMRSLEEEGDGVRAFTGLLLQAMSHDLSAFLVDEPETFLHPPQARLLGRLLVDETGHGAQVVVATHSSDILQGVLDSRSGRDVKIIRLDIETREAATPTRTFTSVDPRKLRDYWNDPLLRYSGILDGIFHSGVVICESESDCMFYSAVLDHMLAGVRAHDLRFIHVSGKARIARAIEVLHQLGVRTAAIVDFDYLNDPSRVRSAVEKSGGQIDVAERLGLIDAEARKNGGAPTVQDLREVAQPILGRTNRSPLTGGEVSAVKEAVAVRSGWGALKRAGIAALDGPAREAAESLLRELGQLGIHVVPVGELERWRPAGGLHGPAWTALALEQKFHETPGADLEEFMRRVARGLGVVDSTL